MSIPFIIFQLKHLVPSDQFHWEVTRVGENKYMVRFPSQKELERLKVFRTFKVPKSTCELTVDSWSQMIELINTLLEIWVRVSGIPENHIGD